MQTCSALSPPKQAGRFAQCFAFPEVRGSAGERNQGKAGGLPTTQCRAGVTEISGVTEIKSAKVRSAFSLLLFLLLLDLVCLLYFYFFLVLQRQCKLQILLKHMRKHRLCKVHCCSEGKYVVFFFSLGGWLAKGDTFSVTPEKPGKPHPSAELEVGCILL